MGKKSKQPDWCQFSPQKSLESFDKKSADKIWFKNDKEIKVSALMPIRVKYVWIKQKRKQTKPKQLHYFTKLFLRNWLETELQKPLYLNLSSLKSWLSKNMSIVNTTYLNDKSKICLTGWKLLWTNRCNKALFPVLLSPTTTIVHLVSLAILVMFRLVCFSH